MTWPWHSLTLDRWLGKNLIRCSTPHGQSERPARLELTGWRSRSARSLRSTAWASNAERRAGCFADC